MAYSKSTKKRIKGIRAAGAATRTRSRGRARSPLGRQRELKRQVAAGGFAFPMTATRRG